jgi:hypothetical protein
MARGKGEATKKSGDETKYSDMLVKDLKEELEKRGLPTTGLKKALVSRLVGNDAKGKKAPAKTVAKSAGKPVAAAKKPAAKPQAKVAAKPPAKAQAKKPVAPKKPVKKVKEPEPEPEESERSEEEKSEDVEEKKVEKKVAKPKVVAKAKPKAPKDDFADVTFPDKAYCINGEELAKLIHTIFKPTGSVAKFEKLFKELEGYVDTETEAQTEVEAEAQVTEAEAHDESEKEGDDTKEKEEEVIEISTLVEEEKAEVTAGSVSVSYNDELGVYVKDGYVWDPNTKSIYAKVVDDSVVQLEADDLTKVFKSRFWHIHVAGRAKDEFPTEEEVEMLGEEAQKFATKTSTSSTGSPKSKVVEAKVVEKVSSASTKPSGRDVAKEKEIDAAFRGIQVEKEEGEVTEEDEELEKYFEELDVAEVPEETVQKTLEAEFKKALERPKVTIEESETEVKEVAKVVLSEKKVGVVSKVDAEIKEVLKPAIVVDEDTFHKYVKAQQTTDKKDDWEVVSEKAGLSREVGKYIADHYYLLYDKYPRVITEVQVSARAAQPQRASRPQMPARATTTVPPRRLLQ